MWEMEGRVKRKYVGGDARERAQGTGTNNDMINFYNTN